jgi:Tfp pilus assembly protein PilO
MNPQSMFETFRRPAVWITIVATIVIAAIWYFAWMSPEGNKLSTENAQISNLNTTLAQLNKTLATYKLNQQNLAVYNKLLSVFSTAVPPEEEAGTLTDEIAALADTSGVNLTELSVPFASAPIESATGTPTGLYQVSLAIDVAGQWSQCMKFLTGIYTFPRLITIQTFSPSDQSGSATGNVDVINPPGKTPYTFDLTATAYFSAAVSGQVTVTTTTAAP